MIYYDFWKIWPKMDKKEKDKIVFKTAYNWVREVRWTVLKIEEGVLAGFRV
jgi:hypothetical protein